MILSHIPSAASSNIQPESLKIIFSNKKNKGDRACVWPPCSSNQPAKNLKNLWAGVSRTGEVVFLF